MNFKRDALGDIVKLLNFNENTLEGLEMEVFYRLLWVMAKAANKDIPPLEVWLEQFDVEPVDFVYTCFPETMDMLWSNIQTTVKK